MVGIRRVSRLAFVTGFVGLGAACTPSKEDAPFAFSQTIGGSGNMSAGSGGRNPEAGMGGRSAQAGMTSVASGGLMEPGPTECDSFVVTGDPTADTGATWTYQSTDNAVEYSLEGVLFSPPGDGPFPAVEIHHGKDGSIKNYTPLTAKTMVTWGLVAIGTQYTHAPDADDEGNLPDGPDGASNENIERARKTYDLLTCLGTVDMTRVATHGHSMGAFINAQLVGTYPGLFAAASHTAGGVSAGPNATRMDAAEKIVTPYSIHHGDVDMTVGIGQDQTLVDILSANGVDYEFFTYEGYDHPDIPQDPTMYERVRAWYESHGVLPAAN